MLILVVDNRGQYTHRIYRTLRDLGVKAEIVPNTSPLREIKRADGIVLSGGAPRISSGDLGRSIEYVREFQGPILGICLGHQAIAIALGGKAGPAEKGEYGPVEIYIDKPEGILHGMGGRMTVWESHWDEVKEPPKGFEILAHSENCRIQAMGDMDRIYGVQFHPEVVHTPRGREIFDNFIKIVKGLI
ncbi:GMP synthase subunit A [Thermococci archaeon]|nr:MAG: GMP synthase subunit A [Thermococci archaeon]